MPNAVTPLLPTLLLASLLLSACERPGSGGAPGARKKARVAIIVVSETYVPLSARGLKEGMRDLGYREGQEIEYAIYDAQGEQGRLPSLVAEALESRPDVVCPSTITAINAVKASGTAVPVVFLESMYPVELGIVKSLTRPDTNFTGVSNMTGPMSGKRLEMLLKMCPRVRKVGLFYNPGNRVSLLSFQATQDAAARLGVQLVARPFEDARTLDAALAAARPGDFDALVLNPDYLVFSRLAKIVAMAKARRIPTMGFDASQVESGLLAGYGGGLQEIARQAAVQVDRVLRGESPATIPVEAPRKYRLFVNLGTAREIGVTLPPDVLYQADGHYP